MKIIIRSIFLVGFFAFGSVWAIPVTINMTTDNFISSGGLCSDANCRGGRSWEDLNDGPLANGSIWARADSITLDLEYGTYYFAWNLLNSSDAEGSGSYTGLLADIGWAGGQNVSSSDWEIYDVSDGSFIEYATEYSQNSPAARNIRSINNGVPVAGISGDAYWINGSTNSESLWIRTSITLADVTNQIPEPATLSLLGIGLAGMISFGRRRQT